MGNQLCNQDTRVSQSLIPNNQKIVGEPSEIKPEDIKVQCEICGQQRATTKLKDHYDYCHFATLVEKATNEFQVTCLLCNLTSDSLEQHKNHLKYKHLYMQSVTRKNTNEQKTNNHLQKNQQIKKRVKQVQKNQFKINEDGTAQIRNEKYNVSSFMKEYGAMEFDEDKTIGDLVWREIFDQHREAICYCIQFIPQQKNIKGESKIFTKILQSARKANAT